MKIKKVFLSLILIVSCFCWVSCGEKSDDDIPAKKIDPTVSVSFNASVEFYVGDRLRDIELIVSSNSTSGTWVWKDENYILQEGDNLCEYVFTPTDTNTYNVVTKKINVFARTALDPEIESVYVKAGQVVYIGAKYSSIELVANSNISTATIAILHPNRVFVEGDNEVDYIFNPNDSDYKQVFGKITIVAEIHQQVESIEVVSNTKNSYKAFDEFDCGGLTLKKIYNAGKTEIIKYGDAEFDLSKFRIKYNNGSCLQQGDASVELTYENIPFVASVEVGYYIVSKPEQIDPATYSGYQTSFTLQSNSDSKYYSADSVAGVDAGTYDLTLTIKDIYKNNCRWAEGDDSLTTVITCVILPADQNVIKTNFEGVYDKESHYSSVESGDAVNNGIYYSKTMLTEDNYAQDGSNNFISETDAGDYTIYYFIVGDKNHNNASGTLSLKIEKATPTLTLRNCYSVYTGNPVSYSNDLIVITGVENEELAKTGLTFSYYSTYNDTTKTKLNSAPINCNLSGDALKDYTVIVNYAGSSNYTEVEGQTILFIDKEDNGLYALDGETGFAFRDKILTATITDNDDNEHTITGSNSECTNYVIFEKNNVNEDGIAGISFTYRYKIASEVILRGEIERTEQSGYVLVCEDGQKYNFTLGENAQSIKFSGSELTLSKWEFPNYLNTYSAVTNEDSDDAEKKETTITIYNDYGTIRFRMSVNVAGIEGYIGSASGSAEWTGVAVCGTDAVVDEKGYILTCYLTTSDSDYQISNNSFVLYWGLSDDILTSGITMGNFNCNDFYKDISDKTYKVKIGA